MKIIHPIIHQIIISILKKILQQNSRNHGHTISDDSNSPNSISSDLNNSVAYEVHPVQNFPSINDNNKEQRKQSDRGEPSINNTYRGYFSPFKSIEE